tara:strand:- start:1554 stop:2318 length:765 start_codon:yes stop_codon:yes gene_type:complete
MDDLSLIQIILLSIIQAITEFLPISSSAHLLLPSKLLGWPDQGIVFDITVHFASLLAVIAYFRDQFLKFSFYLSKTFIFLIVATLPIVLIVLFIDGIGDYRWTLESIAISNIIFATLLLLTDKFSNGNLKNSEMKWLQAAVIGFSQTSSLISGASRSGTAITGALFLGFSREEAARFSLMLSIPTITGALLFSFLEINTLDTNINILETFIGFLTTFIVSYFSIYFFLKLIKSIGYTPFVVYRVLLGVVILCLI